MCRFDDILRPSLVIQSNLESRGRGDILRKTVFFKIKPITLQEQIRILCEIKKLYICEE